MARWDLSRWQSERTSHWLVRAWAEGLQQVLSVSGAAEADIRVMALPPDPAAWRAWENPLWFAQEGDIAPGARLATGCSAATGQALARWVGGEGALDAAAAREAYLGLLKAATATLTGAANQNSVEVNFGDLAESEIPASAALGVSCHFALDGEAHTLALVPNEMLLAALLSGGAGSAPAAALTAPDAEIIPELSLNDHARQNLQIVLDVDLELSVSFGRTTLSLQEVLKLSSGSIVELNRSASDPVELLVNDSVVARGEVVVVDGNYGIRVTEVVSPRQRIRSLL